jgi:hypothetical protein
MRKPIKPLTIAPIIALPTTATKIVTVIASTAPAKEYVQRFSRDHFAWRDCGVKQGARIRFTALARIPGEKCAQGSAYVDAKRIERVIVTEPGF